MANSDYLRKSKPSEVDEESKNRHLVRDGETAFESGLDVDDCPFRKTHQNRSHWMYGWYNARTRKRLGHIFAKYGIEW